MNETFFCTPRSPATGAFESHIVGDPNTPTLVPRASNTPIDPSAAAGTPPAACTRIGNTTRPDDPNRSTNSAAPAADLTTHKNSNPPVRTSSRASTPGTTSANVAVDPSTDGAGNVTPGRLNATSDPNRTTGSEPDPTDTTCGNAAATSLPSRTTNDGSISVHPSTADESSNLTGAAATSSSTTPSGRTHTRVVSDRSDNTSTRSPAARAVTDADTQSGRTNSPEEPDGDGTGDGSAAATGPGSNPSTNASETTHPTPATRRDKPDIGTQPEQAPVIGGRCHKL
ncbi:hypothetical protein [Propionicicella superfundia]|uniref:hypothetical protein n=1 Tax=Propionicicella superfundia TaxID=348582 RepID=UPI00048FB608|nr:hypothetical protein [Propionicicella superfundia]